MAFSRVSNVNIAALKRCRSNTPTFVKLRVWNNLKLRCVPHKEAGNLVLTHQAQEVDEEVDHVEVQSDGAEERRTGSDRAALA